MCGAQAHVRFTPESDIKCDIMECPAMAKSGHCCRIEIIRKCMVDRHDERKAAIHRLLFGLVPTV
jgi:hypothetical protein